MKCSKCGADNTPTAKYCFQCGQELIASPITCPSCHSPVLPGAVFCSYCGKPLAPTGQAPAADEAPAADQAPAAGQTPAVEKAPTAGQASAAEPTPGAPPDRSGAPLVMQTSLGDDNLQVYIANVKGSKIDINYNPTAKPKALPLPVESRPAAFPSLLDRQTELQEVAGALEMGVPVDISGEMGLGKTSLLRAVGNSSQASATRYPGGVVYHRAFKQPEVDLLQSLYATFFQLPNNYKPPPEEIKRGLQILQALVILDDVSLTRDEVTDLRNHAPHCTFVLAGDERALWGEGRALALGGLPPEVSLVLIERELGRALAAQEQPAVSQLCTALKGNPDRLLKTAAVVRSGQTFESILQSLAQTPLTPILLAGLPDPELRVLSAVATGHGAPVPLEHIAPLAGLPDARPLLNELEQRHLVQAHSPSYTLTGALAQELWADWDLTPWAERAVSYFTQWAEAQSTDPHAILPSIDVILQLLEWAVSKHQWVQVLRLGRAIEASLAVGLRWGAWLQVLKWLLMATQALGDRVAEGWVLHQIGTHAVCVGNRQVGQTYLTQALKLRQAIGDRAGMAVTQHNLDLLLGPLALPSQGKPPSSRQPPSAPASAVGALKWILPLIGVTGLLVVAVVIGIWHPWVDRNPTYTPTRFIRPREPTRTFTPRISVGITPAPEIFFELDKGCNQEYPPGIEMPFTYRPNLDGWVTLRLDGQDMPDSTRLEVQAKYTYSGILLIPRQPGEHVLSVFYDLGPVAITRECRFRVVKIQGPTPTPTPTEGPPPAVEIWTEPYQCGGMVEIFSPVLIHVWANQDGQVDFTLRPAQDSFAEWFSIGDVSSVNVAAGKETKLEWRVPEATGLWVLRASLNGGQAEATCEMRVVGKYIPQVNGVTLVPQLPCEDQMVTVSVRVWDEENVGINNVILFYRPAGEAGFREVPTTRIDDLTFQVTFSAPKDGGSEFYFTIIDVFNYPIYTMEQHHRAYSGFLTSGIDYEHTCTAYLIWPDYYLYGMDMMDTPPIVDNMEDCMAQCVDNLSCQSFTWDEAERGCQLKSGIPDPVLREQSISGMEYSVPAP